MKQIKSWLWMINSAKRMSDKDRATQHRRKIEISKRRKLIKITGEEDQNGSKEILKRKLCMVEVQV